MRVPERHCGLQTSAGGSRKPVKGRRLYNLHDIIWVRVKNRYPKWNPGKWKHGPKPAVPWWLNFDPYPFGRQLSPSSSPQLVAGQKLSENQRDSCGTKQHMRFRKRASKWLDPSRFQEKLGLDILCAGKQLLGASRTEPAGESKAFERTNVLRSKGPGPTRLPPSHKRLPHLPD